MAVKQEELDTFIGDEDLENKKCSTSNDIFFFSKDMKQEIEIPKIDETEGIDDEERIQRNELASLIMVTDTYAPINDDNHCRAVHTLPPGFALMQSRIKEGGCLGVFTKFFLPNGVGFGPCEGDITQEYSSRYCWKILRADAVSHYLDSADGRRSNWMKFVKPSFVQSEENLDIFQHKEQLYYKTTKDILANTELFLNGDSFLKFATLVMCITFEVDTVDKINKRIEQTSELLALKQRNERMKKNIPDQNSSLAIPVYVPENTTKNKSTSLRFQGPEATFEQHEKNDININAVKNIKDHNICTDAISQNGPIYVPQIEKTTKNETNHSGYIKLKAFNCSVCEKTFTTSDSLRRHLELHRRRTYSCKICGKLFTQRYSFVVHQRIHTGAKPYTCSTCGKYFMTPHNLAKHIKTHTKESFICTLCGVIKYRYDHLLSHMLIHEGEKEHKCDVCKRVFTRFDDLKSHMETHLKYRELVGEKLARIRSLKQHIVLNANERPFECAICEKTFVQNNQLANHMKLHSRPGPYKHECDECGMMFKLTQDLRKHVKLHNE